MIAQVLKLFNIPIDTVDDIFPGRPEGVPDEEIIPWLAANDAVWITADFARKKENRERREYDLKAQGISAIWMHRPKAGLGNWDQVKIIARTWDRMHAEFRSTSKARHFWVSQRGGPTIQWRQT